jgi:hypothetical protein
MNYHDSEYYESLERENEGGDSLSDINKKLDKILSFLQKYDLLYFDNWQKNLPYIIVEILETLKSIDQKLSK